MTPQDQVKRIINLLNPENPDEQTDAVFLVERAIKKLKEKVHAKDKQIAKLEEELTQARKETLILSNEKRDIQTNHAQQIEQIEAGKKVTEVAIEEKAETVTQEEATNGEENQS